MVNEELKWLILVDEESNSDEQVLKAKKSSRSIELVENGKANEIDKKKKAKNY